MATEPASLDSMQRLIAQLRQEGSCHSAEVTAETRFVADLGFASLELIALVFLCEQAFDVSLASQPALLAELQTVGGTVEAICKLQQDGRLGDVSFSSATSGSGVP